MPLRRRPEGSWIADIRLGGERHRKTFPAGLGKREVQALARAWEAEIAARGRRRGGAAHTLGDLTARYWREHGRFFASRATEKSYLDLWCDALGDATPVDEITTDRLASIVARWRTTPILRAQGEPKHKPRHKRARPAPRVLSASSINHRLRCLQRVCNLALDAWGWDLPRVAWRRLRLQEQSDLPDRSLSVKEAAALLEALPDRSRAAFRLALATGLRLGAVLRLTRADVDLDRGVIRAISKGRGGGKRSGWRSTAPWRRSTARPTTSARSR